MSAPQDMPSLAGRRVMIVSSVGGHLDESVLAVPGQEDWRPPATPGGNPSFLGHPYLVSANMGVHREDFEAVGGFDTTLIRGEDIAVSWALIERGIELGHVPIGGPGGSLAVLAGMSGRSVYVHIAASNPLANRGAKERTRIEQAGASIGTDGFEVEI